MTQKILIIGSGGEGKTALMLQSMKEKYGDDIVLVTPQEAKEQGLKPEDFANTTNYITAPPIMEQRTWLGPEKSGKEKRRQRREQQRKANKKRK